MERDAPKGPLFTRMSVQVSGPLLGVIFESENRLCDWAQLSYEKNLSAVAVLL
jgi:hypothetical protein